MAETHSRFPRRVNRLLPRPAQWGRPTSTTPCLLLFPWKWEIRSVFPELAQVVQNSPALRWITDRSFRLLLADIGTWNYACPPFDGAIPMTWFAPLAMKRPLPGVVMISAGRFRFPVIRRRLIGLGDVVSAVVSRVMVTTGSSAGER